MRRLVQHAIAGIGFAAVVATAAVASVSSPVVAGSASADVPSATIVQSALESHTLSAAASSPVSLALAAARAEAKNSRGLERAQLSQEAEQAAIARAQLLQAQGQAIAAQQDKMEIAAAKAAAAKLRAKAAAAKAAKARAAAIRKQGYEPGTTDPREIARQILKNKYGYGAGQFSCFNNIIMRESMWNIHATNASSGAYGIPQALPGNKMATIASDWRTNPATQIIWGIEYMKSTYGSPCGAWGFKSSHGWY